jgi:hypothetical protein
MSDAQDNRGSVPYRDRAFLSSCIAAVGFFLAATTVMACFRANPEPTDAVWLALFLYVGLVSSLTTFAILWRGASRIVGPMRVMLGVLLAGSLIVVGATAYMTKWDWDSPRLLGALTLAVTAALLLVCTTPELYRTGSMSLRIVLSTGIAGWCFWLAGRIAVDAVKGRTKPGDVTWLALWSYVGIMALLTLLPLLWQRLARITRPMRKLLVVSLAGAWIVAGVTFFETEGPCRWTGERIEGALLLALAAGVLLFCSIKPSAK